MIHLAEGHDIANRLIIRTVPLNRNLFFGRHDARALNLPVGLSPNNGIATLAKTNHHWRVVRHSIVLIRAALIEFLQRHALLGEHRVGGELKPASLGRHGDVLRGRCQIVRNPDNLQSGHLRHRRRAVGDFVAYAHLAQIAHVQSIAVLRRINCDRPVTIVRKDQHRTLIICDNDRANGQRIAVDICGSAEQVNGNRTIVFIGRACIDRLGHRGVVGAGHGYNHRLGSGAAVAVIHGIGEAVGRRLALSQILKGAPGIVGDCAIGIERDIALRQGVIHRCGQCIALHIRRRWRDHHVPSRQVRVKARLYTAHRYDIIGARERYRRCELRRCSTALVRQVLNLNDNVARERLMDDQHLWQKVLIDGGVARISRQRYGFRRNKGLQTGIIGSSRNHKIIGSCIRIALITRCVRIHIAEDPAVRVDRKDNAIFRCIVGKREIARRARNDSHLARVEIKRPKIARIWHGDRTGAVTSRTALRFCGRCCDRLQLWCVIDRIHRDLDRGAVHAAIAVAHLIGEAVGAIEIGTRRIAVAAVCAHLDRAVGRIGQQREAQRIAVFVCGHQLARDHRVLITGATGCIPNHRRAVQRRQNTDINGQDRLERTARAAVAEIRHSNRHRPCTFRIARIAQRRQCRVHRAKRALNGDGSTAIGPRRHRQICQRCKRDCAIRCRDCDLYICDANIHI